ncbi:MAG: type IV secretion system DNA-binding domain-containing protein [Roseiarcus sp.]|jgi:hypothetical protein
MKFKDLNVGYTPRQYPLPGILTGFKTMLVASAGQFVALLCLAPKPGFDRVIDQIATWDAIKSFAWEAHGQLRLSTSLAVGVVAGVVALRHAWKHTPLMEPFTRLDEDDPRVFYGEDAQHDLRNRLFNEAGWEAQHGLYLAPHFVLPRPAELKNILLVGTPNSGKSNIIRALIDQAIERGDRLLILCNKGDMTQSFSADEAILIAPHHADSYVLDLAFDISDAAAAMQFAVDIIPRSTPPFWSDSARLIFVDILLNEIVTRGSNWTARTLLDATLQDSETIRRATRKIDLSAGALLAGGGAEGEDKTVAGILATMRSAAFANLRFLAWASESTPQHRRFSVKRWLAKGYTGPLTVIAQFSPEHEELSTLVIGGLLKRIVLRLTDPIVPIDPRRRVLLALDEFDSLQKIEGLDGALAKGREKGLYIILGIQNVDQVIKKYGRELANVIFGLFQIKIYGRLEPGDGAALVSEWMGKRHVSALVKNRAPAADDKRRLVEERRDIATYSASRLAKRLGLNKENPQAIVRAAIHCYGQVYEMEWPLTLWNKKREGYIPASWIKRIPQSDPHRKK